jgi:predicted HicB family RNase H-like nuclease
MGNALNAMKSKAHIEEHSVQLGEMADALYDNHTLNNPPSLAALKLQDLLMKTAGGKICEDRWHQLDLASLKGIKGMRNATHQDVVELFRQLRTATLTYRNEAEGYTGIYGLISVGRVEFEEQGKIRFKFDEEFRKVLEFSNLYAVLDRQTSLALSSRYAHRLHEMIALRAGRDKISEKFTVTDLRARLGVPNGKLATWSHFKQFALQKAIDELNHLSRFKVSWRVSKKYRRRVDELELTWQVNRDLDPVAKELRRPKVGRKARRDGRVEALVEPFPASGSISYSEPWKTIARQHGSGKDINLIANDFRRWCKSKGIPLDGSKISKQFETFSKGVKL